MSVAEELVTYVFKWVTVVDERTCKRCLELDGKEWYGQDLFESAVWDDIYGEVWGLNAEHSLLHPNCRCQLQITVEIHVNEIEIYELTVGKRLSGRLKPLGKLVRIVTMSTDIARLREQVRGLKVDLQEVTVNITEFNRLFTTYLALARRTGMPENIAEFLSRVQQMRIAVQTLHRSIMLLYASSGPVGWAIGLGGLALSGIMLADQMEMRRPQY